MKRTYTLSHQYIATVLLFSLCLQSCGGGFDNNPPIPIGEKQIASMQTNTQAIPPRADIHPLVGKILTTQGGDVVTFYQEAGELKADIVINVPKGFSKTYEGINVYIEQGAELATLAQLDTKDQQRRIHLHPAKSDQPAKVIIYKGAGLMGGGESEDEGEEEGTYQVVGEEKEEEKIVGLRPKDNSEVVKDFSVEIVKDVFKDYVKLAITAGIGSIIPSYAFIYESDKLDFTTCCLLGTLMAITSAALYYKYSYKQPSATMCTEAKEVDKKFLLHNAVKGGNVEIIRNLIDMDANLANINLEEGAEKITPLDLAAKLSNLEVAEVLISLGADIKPNTGINLFRLAVETNDLELIKELINLLIEKDVDVNGKEEKSGKTLLHMAVEKKCLEVIERLIKAKANVNLVDKEGRTPLDLLVNTDRIWDKDLKIAKLLLGAGAIANTKYMAGICLLYAAIEQKDLELIRILVDSKSVTVNPDLDLLQEIIKYIPRNPHFPSCISKVEYKYTPLHIAIYKGDIEIVRYLLEKGAAVNVKNDKGETPLNMDVSLKNTELVKLLLDAKADVNIQDGNGDALLHEAAKKGNIEIANLLIKNGADVKLRNSKGKIPLHLAVSKNDSRPNNNFKVAELLLDCGADVNAADLKGNTPFHIATKKGSLRAMELLIGKGANLNLKNKPEENKPGMTPLDLAKEKRDPRKIKLLKEALSQY